jgi:hypothetical protein
MKGVLIMTFKKICPICKKEFTSEIEVRDICYICNPFDISIKNSREKVIVPPISKEEKEELAKEQNRKTVQELLQEAEEQGTV